jgi:hypothetical protein
MTTPYGEAGERFTNTAFLVFVNRIVSIVAAGLLLRGETTRESPDGSRPNLDGLRPIAPLSSYLAIAMWNFLATFCQ